MYMSDYNLCLNELLYVYRLKPPNDNERHRIEQNAK